MTLQVGIVGLPNVGKSTLFNALVKRQVALAANYPFATVEPNVGVVKVPDKRLFELAKIIEQEEHLELGKVPTVPAIIKFVDIAGLVKGAAEGEGLGNQFLAHIREADLICHVLRVFTDSDVAITGKLDPVEDLDTVRTELILKDLETVEKNLNAKAKNQSIKEKIKREETLKKIKSVLEQGNVANSVSLTKIEQEIIYPLQLLTNKPEIFALNVDEDQVGSKIKLSTEIDPINTIVISAKIENELANLSEKDQQAYLQELGLQQSGIERIARLAYNKLNLISFLTAGVKEARAWTIPKGTIAASAAGVIHTDFVKHFIKANVVNYQDFITISGWKTAHEQGRVRQEGKDYVISDGDVVEFMIGK